MTVYIDTNIDGTSYYLVGETEEALGPIKAEDLGKAMKEAAREIYDQTGEVVNYVFL